MNPIRHFRLAQGMTQDQLAQRIGRSISYVSHLEKGDYLPGRDVLLRLADLFQMDPTGLITALSIPERATLRVAEGSK